MTEWTIEMNQEDTKASGVLRIRGFMLHPMIADLHGVDEAYLESPDMWIEGEGELCIQVNMYDLQPEDPEEHFAAEPSETLSAAERNPSMCSKGLSSPF